MIAPCMNCESRTKYCHAKCQVYSDFKKERDKISENRRKDNEKEGYTALAYDRMRRLRKHG